MAAVPLMPQMVVRGVIHILVVAQGEMLPGWGLLPALPTPGVAEVAGQEQTMEAPGGRDLLSYGSIHNVLLAPFSLTAAFCAAIFMLAGPVAGQEPQSRGYVCALHDTIVQGLESGWGESQAGLGINSAGALVEVFVSADHTTWTIVVTRPDGWSCIVTAGRDWQQTQPKPPGAAL